MHSLEDVVSKKSLAIFKRPFLCLGGVWTALRNLTTMLDIQDLFPIVYYILVDKICSPMVNENVQSIDKMLHLKEMGWCYWEGCIGYQKRHWQQIILRSKYFCSFNSIDGKNVAHQSIRTSNWRITFSNARKLKTSHWDLVYKSLLLSYQLQILHAEYFPRTSLFNNSIVVSAFFIFHGKLPKHLRLLQRSHGLEICMVRADTISELRFIRRIVFVFDVVFVFVFAFVFVICDCLCRHGLDICTMRAGAMRELGLWHSLGTIVAAVSTASTFLVC